MTIRKIKIISILSIGAYALSGLAVRNILLSGPNLVAGVAYVTTGIFLFLFIGMSWRCPTCIKYTIIFSKHCIRCGSKLEDDQQGIVK